MKDEMLFQRAWVLDVNSKVFPSPLYPYDVRNKPTAIDFASRRVVEEKKADDVEESQVTIFFKTTSITALNQVQYTNSYLLKSYWIILFLIGLVVSIFQSYLVINNFLKFGVLEKTRLTLQGNIEFPSVTVCVNMPLKWDNVTYKTDTSIKRFVDDMQKYYEIENEKDTAKKHLAVINALSAVDRKKRMALGVPTKEFVLYCTARELDETFEDCLDHLHDSNSLYHGNCATFNPKLTDEKYQKWLLSTDLNMALKFYTTPEYADPRREVSLMVIIHQAGTAPVLKEALHISAGDFLEIDVFKKDLHRLAWPYTSECLNAYNHRIRQMSNYYDETHPYIYTIEACIDSCIQNLTLYHCECFLSNYVLKSTGKRSIKECVASCENIPAGTLSKMCGCKNPCDCFEYNLKVQRHPEKFYIKDFMENFMERKITDEEFTQYTTVGAVGFSISLTSQFVDVMDEHPEEQALNMLGNIGGVFGLWIGISIMSVFEVLVSIYDGFMRMLCKKLRTFKIFRPSAPTPSN